jgi:hypothetical protein
MDVVTLYTATSAIEPVIHEILAIPVVLTVIKLGVITGPAAAPGFLLIGTLSTALPAVVDVMHQIHAYSAAAGRGISGADNPVSAAVVLVGLEVEALHCITDLPLSLAGTSAVPAIGHVPPGIDTFSVTHLLGTGTLAEHP